MFIGPYLTVAAVWNIADICNGLMAFPNLIALFAPVPGVVGKETRAYFAEKKRHDLKAMAQDKNKLNSIRFSDCDRLCPVTVAFLFVYRLMGGTHYKHQSERRFSK